MESNIFDFDDISCHQLNGTAMGTSVACMYATIYFSYHEENRIFRPGNPHKILLYARFIDDGFLIQRQLPGNHACFVNDMNNFGPKGRRLTWDSSGPQRATVFLDLSLRIAANGQLHVSTYIKPLNLHLYIPAFSAHAPSVNRGMIYGMLRRYWLQNTSKDDFTRLARDFYHHLQARGHDAEYLQQEFLRTADQLDKAEMPKSNRDSDGNLLFLHVQYHPFQISRKEIQSIFQRDCSDVLRTAKNERLDDGERMKINRLIIAQSRATNLRDRLCRSRLELQPDARASAFVERLTERKL